MRPLVFVVLIALGGEAAHAQDVPHDFRQDTPPVPGQIIERPRDTLRLAPPPLRAAPPDKLGLPPSGPMGVLRETHNEPAYTPPSDR